MYVKKLRNVKNIFQRKIFKEEWILSQASKDIIFVLEDPHVIKPIFLKHLVLETKF